MLKRIELPQIKTLILRPPTVYPLVRRCQNVESVMCAVGVVGPSDKLIGATASNRDSKVKGWRSPLFLVVVYPVSGFSALRGPGLVVVD